jgi:small neutral amino acid transporter SnatA (MarC family)
MFSSSKDMEGTAEILIILVVISILAYILGFRFHASYLDKILTKEIIGAIQKSVIFLLAPIVVDMFALGAVKLFKNREG